MTRVNILLALLQTSEHGEAFCRSVLAVISTQCKPQTDWQSRALWTIGFGLPPLRAV